MSTKKNTKSKPTKSTEHAAYMTLEASLRALLHYYDAKALRPIVADALRITSLEHTKELLEKAPDVIAYLAAVRGLEAEGLEAEGIFAEIA